IPVETCRPLLSSTRFFKSIPLPRAAASGAGRLVHLATNLPLAESGALVVELFASRQPELDLGPAILEIEAERNQSKSLFADPSAEAIDLPLMKEELPIPLGIVVGVRAVAVGVDVAAEEPAFPVSDGCVAVLEVHQAGPERLDLGPAEHQAGLHRLEDLV